MARVNSVTSMPASMRVQLFPKSLVFHRYGLLSLSWKRFAAMYAVPGAKCDGSISDTRVYAAMSFGVTFCHVLPLSRDTCTNPSSDPAHSTPFCFGDSANEK